MRFFGGPLSSLFLSLLFPGLGQFYNGYAKKALIIVALSFGLPFSFGLSNLSSHPIGFAVLMILIVSIFVYQLIDAYLGAKKNQGRQFKHYNNWYYYLVFVFYWVFAYYYFPSAIFRFQAFHIPTPAMEDCLLVGDRIVVDVDDTNVNTNDIVVFHTPGLRENNFMEYDQSKWVNLPIKEKTPYVKRCIGLPGDIISIQAKRIKINDTFIADAQTLKYRFEVICRERLSDRTLKGLDLDPNDQYILEINGTDEVVYSMYLSQSTLSQLRNSPFVLSINESQLGPDFSTFPYYSNAKWNSDNYGPLKIPMKGMTITINDSTIAIYGNVIKDYENNGDVRLDSLSLAIGGKEIREYTFKQNYYFMIGDNRHNSLDSRYWGFVPEDHLMGVARFVYFSFDGFNKSIRWNRCLISLK